MVSTVDGACVEWATARMVAPGHSDSGDQCCVRTIDHRTMIAVFDGLGHGPAAASAARLGVQLLEQSHAHDVVTLVRECHGGLRGSRGAVMSLAMFDSLERTMTWIGVGNVHGSLWCPQSTTWKSLLLRSGVVGDVLPSLRESVVAMNDGDTLVFTTDGVGSEIDDRLLKGDSLQITAERILSRCRTGHDDALVLLARYRGTGR
jgi:negative regulator of sigma-B (phosphoserine phosphatase)